MNPLHLLRRPTRFWAAGLLAPSLVGCSTTRPATFGQTAKTVFQDAASPAGRKLLAEVTATALNVGLDLAAGRDAEAALAGIQGAASAVRDYEGMPTAPSNTTVAQAAALGSGVTRVATTLAPEVRSLLEDARQSAAQQNIRVSTDDLIEALARGLDAVAANQPSPAPTQP